MAIPHFYPDFFRTLNSLISDLEGFFATILFGLAALKGIFVTLFPSRKSPPSSCGRDV
jgi:hypothetical protein